MLLDFDVTQWAGPETVTITESNGASGIYHHFIYVYSYPSLCGFVALMSYF